MIRQFSFGRAYVRNEGLGQLIFYGLTIIFPERFSRKVSRSWHWHDYKKLVQKTVLVKGDSEAKPVTDRWSGFWQINFGWQTVVLLTPSAQEANGRYYPRERNYDGTKRYKIGFISRRAGIQKICSVEITGTCAVLIGDGDVEFFAVDAESGRELKLVMNHERSRQNLIGAHNRIVYPLI